MKGRRTLAVKREGKSFLGCLQDRRPSPFLADYTEAGGKEGGRWGGGKRRGGVRGGEEMRGWKEKRGEGSGERGEESKDGKERRGAEDLRKGKERKRKKDGKE